MEVSRQPHVPTSLSSVSFTPSKRDWVNFIYHMDVLKRKKSVPLTEIEARSLKQEPLNFMTQLSRYTALLS